MNTIKTLLPILVLAMVFSCEQQKKEDAKGIKIVTGQHHDEGPDYRYSIPYEPIAYGQKVKAPLPGLTNDYKMIDWDGDGLVDLLGNLRRGRGIVFYKNVGTKTEPLFRSLEDNEVLMPKGDIGRFFDVVDVDGDGKREIMAYEPQVRINQSDTTGRLMVFFNDGTTDNPIWIKKYVLNTEGKGINSANDVWDSPRMSIADWDGDGRQDIIIGYENAKKIVPESDVENIRTRNEGFKDPSVYSPNQGKVAFLKNVTREKGTAVFENEKIIEADGKPIETFTGPYPFVYDFNKDGMLDLIVGAHDMNLRIYLNSASTGEPKLKYSGLIKDGNGNPLNTFLTLRIDEADLDGDGQDEFVGTSYYGNNDRFLVYEKEGEKFIYKDYLKIQAVENTSVYGMGNSTVDPVDFDSDGDTDLLLGAEGGFPTIVKNVGSDKNRKYAPAERLKFVDGSPVETASIVTGDGSHWGPMEWYSDRITPRAFDWDEDGVLDIISGSMGRRLYFYKGQMVKGELRFHPPKNFRYDGVDLNLPDRLFPAILDWDKDGIADIMVSNHPGNVVVYKGNRTLELGKPDTLMHVGDSAIIIQDYWERKKGNRSGYATADWNNDGHPDLVIYMFHRGVFLFLNNGTNKFGPPQLLVPLYSHLAGPSVIDWDKDGILDLLIGGDERRMIETSIPAHLVVFHGEDLKVAPIKR